MSDHIAPWPMKCLVQKRDRGKLQSAIAAGLPERFFLDEEAITLYRVAVELRASITGNADPEWTGEVFEHAVCAAVCEVNKRHGANVLLEVLAPLFEKAFEDAPE